MVDQGVLIAAAVILGLAGAALDMWSTREARESNDLAKLYVAGMVLAPAIKPGASNSVGAL